MPQRFQHIHKFFDVGFFHRVLRFAFWTQFPTISHPLMDIRVTYGCSSE